MRQIQSKRGVAARALEDHVVVMCALVIGGFSLVDAEALVEVMLL